MSKVEGQFFQHFSTLLEGHAAKSLAVPAAVFEDFPQVESFGVGQGDDFAGDGVVDGGTVAGPGVPLSLYVVS